MDWLQELRNLLNLLDDPDPKVKDCVSARISELSRMAETSYLEDDDDFDLGEAAFLLASHWDPSFSRQQWDDFICTAISLFYGDDGEEKTAIERITLFNYLFFNRLHFVIEENCGNCSIPEVIAERRGCAPTVALLWFVLASEAELPILPLVHDGGFAPVWMEDGRELLRLDLTNGGSPILDYTTGILMPLKSLPFIWIQFVAL